MSGDSPFESFGDLLNKATWRRAEPSTPPPPAKLVIDIDDDGCMAAIVSACPSCSDGWIVADGSALECPICGPMRREAGRLNAARLPALPEGATFNGFRIYCDGPSPVDPPAMFDEATGIVYEATETGAARLDDDGERMWHPGQYRREALATVERLCAQVETLDKDDRISLARVPNVLLVGPPGTGKSKLLIAMLRHLSRTAKLPVRYEHFGGLMSKCRDSLQAQRRTQRLIDALVAVPILGLDEIGAGRATDWEQDVANEVISRRADKGRPVWGTSNYSLERDPPKNDMGALRNRVGLQTVSRLLGRCKVLPLIGADLREIDR